MKDLIRYLLAYDRWANSILLSLVQGLKEEDLTRKFGSSYDTIVGTVAHILQGEYAYSSRWLYPDRPERPTGDEGVPELLRRFHAHEERMLSAFEAMSEADLQVGYEMPRGGTELTIQTWQLYLAVVNHGIHHRAELADMLTLSGSPPPPMDYPDFLVSNAAS